MGLGVVVGGSVESVNVAVGQTEYAVLFGFNSVTIGVVRRDGVTGGGRGDREEREIALGGVPPAAVAATVAGTSVSSQLRGRCILGGVITVAIIATAI